MLAVVLLALTLTVPASNNDMVLVKTDEALELTDSETVLGWRRVPADRVSSGQRVVPDVELALVALDPATEPFGPDQWALAPLGVPRAWQESTGSGVVIAVVDSGVALDHPDLADRIFVNRNEVPGNGRDDDGNGLIDDVNGWDVVDADNDPTDISEGHGTEVAGVAAASLNGLGIAGVAPEATILPIRACRSSCNLFSVAWAVTYATDMGADVINLSLGGYATDPGPLADAVEYARLHGVIVVAAAGNLGDDIDNAGFVPAGLPHSNLVAVAAVDRDGHLWTESNRGPATVDLAAPGIDIVSTTLDEFGTYRTRSGTSYAAPHVSAVAALMRAVRPSLTPEEAIGLLGRTGTPLTDLVPSTVFGTRIRADAAVVGAGLVDVGGTFENDIIWLALGGVTRGCNPPVNDRFCPHDPITRGQMAAFLHRLFALPDGPDAFDDDDESIFQPHINAIAHAGISRGCDPPANRNFCADRLVTRGEMAAFLHRVLNLPNGPDAFDDDNESIFQPHINAIAHAGISRGCDPPANRNFCPDRLVTRGEMAAFLHRALGD